MPERGVLGAVEPAVNLSTIVNTNVTVNQRLLHVAKKLGEGGFSFVYLVRDVSSEGGSSGGGVMAVAAGLGASGLGGSSSSTGDSSNEMVLKITSIQNREQRSIAEKEAMLLRRLSHPSIVTLYDVCFRSKEGRIAPQHMILMEHCEMGHALDVIQRMIAAEQTFSLKELIVSFGQICNAVSYLHAQTPPVVHRDLKLENFLVTRGGAQYKLCDFGSAVFGHVSVETQSERTNAEDLIQKTTTQMYRAPEMIDLYLSKVLTQSTDVWALGCCLYAMAFFQNCFEEGSNLAILARNYKIPDKKRSIYGDGLVELLDRMLTVDCEARADMTEVITCLSAIYSRKPLPKRKRQPRNRVEPQSCSSFGTSSSASAATPSSRSTKKLSVEEDNAERVGTYRTDGQGIQELKEKPRRPVKKQAKKLDPNSAAARRRRGRSGPAEADHSPASHNPSSRTTPTSSQHKEPNHQNGNASKEGRGGESPVRRASYGSPRSSSGRSISDEGEEPPRNGKAGRRASLGSTPSTNDKNERSKWNTSATFDSAFDESFSMQPFDAAGSNGGGFASNPFAGSFSKNVPACDSIDPFDFESFHDAAPVSERSGRRQTPSKSGSSSFEPFDDELGGFHNDKSKKGSNRKIRSNAGASGSWERKRGNSIGNGGKHRHAQDRWKNDGRGRRPNNYHSSSSYESDEDDAIEDDMRDKVGNLRPDSTFEEV